ncbi:Gfo/Idh/MocA family protein [Nonomuraea sp. NPDC048826]|uniref:Gfo/Idh/MocA family protein n=1 Tax=Nonomuraea sp. NPDC048826 TaxID=3364347 RepID=UPI003717A921
MSGSGLTWGIAGYGDIVRKRALPALLALGETVACVWGRDAARARATCDAFAAGFGTSDYGELLAASDVVYVATPVAAHLPLAAAAARAGLPVLVEKPLGSPPHPLKPHAAEPHAAHPHAGPLKPHAAEPHAAEPHAAEPHAAEPHPTKPHSALLDAAALDAAHVGVAYYRRLAPAVRRVRELLGGRAVRRVEVAYQGSFDPGPDDPKVWRTDPALSGGGVLADVGSHRLDLLCLLLGEPVVTGAEVGLPFPRGAERVARARLAWPDGASGAVDTAWRPGPRHDRLLLVFDGGRLELDPLDSGWVRGTVDGVTVEQHLPPPANAHAPLMADFARSVRDGTAPVCPVRDARAVDRLISAVYAAATTLEEDT